MKTRLTIKSLTFLLFLAIFYSCNNEVETKPAGPYTAAEKKALKEIANSYGAEIYFRDNIIATEKMSSEELTGLLKTISNMKLEFPIAYSYFYKTPSKAMIPKSRAYSSTETRPIPNVKVDLGDYGSFSTTGTIIVNFDSTDDKIYRVKCNQINFESTPKYPQYPLKYRYSLECIDGYSVDENPFTIKSMPSTITARSKVNIVANSSSKASVILAKKECCVTFPTTDSIAEASCSIY